MRQWTPGHTDECPMFVSAFKEHSGDVTFKCPDDMAVIYVSSCSFVDVSCPCHLFVLCVAAVLHLCGSISSPCFASPCAQLVSPFASCSVSL